MPKVFAASSNPVRQILRRLRILHHLLDLLGGLVDFPGQIDVILTLIGEFLRNLLLQVALHLKVFGFLEI